MFLLSFSIFDVMQGIFAHACCYEWLLNNPISLVRQSAKRRKCLTFWMPKN